MKVDLLPTYVSLKEGEVDLRYFLIASGNFSLVGRDTLDKEDSEYERKTFVDDLEVPVKKRQTVSQLLGSIQRYFTNEKAAQISEVCAKYQAKKIGASLVLADFQNILGVIKGFKYCWALALALTYGGGNEINKELKQAISEMKIKNEDCVLVRHGKSYRSVYKYLMRQLSDYLLDRVDSLDSFPETQINTMMRSMFSYEVGDLIQGKYLQHYISAKSLSVLMQIFFADKSNYEDMFEECVPRDLITVFIYWAIIKSKCNQAPGTTPGFRGIDWLREVEDTLDLSFIKILTPEETKAKEIKKAQKEVTNKSDFPTLNEEIGSHGNKKTLFELMHMSHKEQFQTFKKKGKKTNTQPKKTESPVQSAPQSTSMRGRGGKRPQPSRADAWGVDSNSEDDYEKKKKLEEIKRNELEYLNDLKKAENKIDDKKKSGPVEEFADHFPTLGASAPPPKQAAAGLQRLPLHMASASTTSKGKEVDDDFPTLGGPPLPAGPTIFDQMKQPKKTPAKKPEVKQPQKKPEKTDASKSIVALQQKPKEKEGREDFPSLGGGGGYPIYQPPQPVAAKKEEPKSRQKEVNIPVYSAPDYHDAVDFDDEQPAPAKKEKKKQTKLHANDFPILESKVESTQFVSQYEARRNQPLDIHEHLTPEEKAAYGIGIGQGRNQLKPPKSKKFDDLEETPAENAETKPKAVDPKPAKQFAKPKDDDEEFPTMGSGPAPAKGSSIQPKDFSKAVAIESSDIVISKKSNKKK